MPNTQPHLKRRIVATIIDYGLWWITFFFYTSYLGTPEEDGSMKVEGLRTLPLLAYWFIYFVFAETIFGMTLGHWLSHLKVVGLNGREISFVQALKRRLLDPFDMFLFGIPAIIAIKNTPNHQRLGDLWARTTVIDSIDNEIETEEKFLNESA